MSLFDDAPTYDEPTTIDRKRPHDLDDEKAVIGAMIVSKSAINEITETIGHVADDAFYQPAHRILYRVIVEMHSEGTSVDPRTLAAEVANRGVIREAGGPLYPSELVQSVPSAANGAYYAENVLRLYKWRRLIEATERATHAGYMRVGEPEAAIEAAVAEIAAIGALSTTKEPYAPIVDAVEAALDAAEEAAKDTGELTGIPTGYMDFDSLTNGLQAGQMIVIGARPAMGKSTAALDMARCAAIKHRRPTAFFTLEMTAAEVGARTVSAEARVGLHHLRGGTMTDEDWTRVARRMPKIGDAPLFISDTASMTLGQIRTVCHRIKQKHGLDLIVIDYLQLMQSASTGRGSNRQQEIADFARGLKLLAKEFDAPVVVLSQLNRGNEQRTDKKPVLSDLRESGAIEQDADIVILLHREDAYDKESPRAGEGDLIVAKHRNGPTATITVGFQGHYSRFVDMAQT